MLCIMEKKKKYITVFMIIIFLASIVGFSFFNYNEKKANYAKGLSAVKKSKDLKKQEIAKKQRELKIYEDQSNTMKIPILMYHWIEDGKGDELKVSKEKFKGEMDIVKQSGYTPISFDELYDFINNKKPFSIKPILITFDDGYEDNYVNAYPVLKEFGFKATVFAITDLINTCPYLSDKEIIELSKNNVDVESHAASHSKLSFLSYDRQYDELKRSKERLEEILHKKEYYLAYPFGKYNRDTIDIAHKLGYRLAACTKEGFASKADGNYELKRIYISNNYSLEEFKRLIN
ncbi:Polysaccharide deacetylase-like protein; Xylanase/chitin deacetylase family enzyme [Clostridium acetobutylicum EA 2018]|uniref:Polysaccharide deacetylase-like protein Xylanase/chitin deacetylase family enzyme n=2 Tax=Clostridiaceae TaxID=31979 RepID=Q97GQ0_CLOAB|nr:Polysaccharide deacetylase-like protein; Xylanase/chitin deacetylase family enzyme [Clostridium acetobutylicum ATCC 824]ADZ21368.1 Polysaccharide deacetylase-like protein; Xylanase/chitin deacetylase family enzyme [Clostridium acetobutylicum EA 2018]AEI33196.1 polysaccharide deacetylase-like protein [Clostridium acetobutylicum DSM 1731]AWV79305.1 polysaccharide deacetylase family protein [Clostridium acetobutylicum]PSM07265.1 polysaccharide deacetylase family protein [Clostridium sp. NJ4]